MIKDCIRIFTAAFCAEKRLKIKVAPENDVKEAAEFVSLLSGRCEISEYQCAALIKPLKKRPAASCAIPVPRAGRELFFLIAGIAAQMDLVVRFDDVYEEVTDEELEHISFVTQGQLRIIRLGKGICVSSLLYNENPLFGECREPVFAAGLCLGGLLARAGTYVSCPEGEEGELVRFTLEEILGYGVEISAQLMTKEYVLHSILSTRLPEKKPKKQKTEKTEPDSL